MKTCIATVSISGNLTEKLDAIAKAGFDGIEIFEQDFIADAGSPRDVGNMVRDLGLQIMLFQPFRDFEGLPDAQRAKAFDRAERKFDLMQELGTDLVLVCSSVSPDAMGGIDRAAADFRELGERAAKRNLRVGYEALAWGRHVNDHRDAWEIVRRADHPNIGLILDSFHTLARKIEPDTIRRIPGDKVFFVQLADAPLIEMDLLYWSRHFRNMPGEGDLAVADFMRAVMATGYGGPLSLEIFNDQFRGGSAKTIAKDGYRSLVALMDTVRRAEPGLQVDLPAMPAPITTKGVAFVEFATQGASAQELETLLTKLGFCKCAQHIAKNVNLWQQGEIRIVVNTETTGFAHSAYVAHGTTVCDIGIAVGNAEATVDRATKLGADAFSQPIGPGERLIPAIKGLGGGIIHFLEPGGGQPDVWTTEFTPTGNSAEGAGLTGIDHLAQTTSYDEMLSWTLFYCSLFDMRKAPMLDVIDPDGLVRSQAIAAPDGALRITLNGAETHRTLAGKFLAGGFGSSLQHIAFSTEDIFDTAVRLRALGFEPLPIPTNYYDDLAARFDLPADQLARMRDEQILYDRDAGGEFFQLYSKPYGKGMFFEIVERRAKYQGYGAPNAPFRIAAQKRLLAPKGMPSF
ncbi:MAG: TIM barrel protein [Paracoccaceae bacterium]